MISLWMIIFPLLAWSQSKQDQAYRLGIQGIDLVDSGQYEEGIKLLKLARNLQPHDYDYSLEIGKAYLRSGNAKKAEKYLFELQYHQQVNEELYLELANCYQKINEQRPSPDLTRKKELDALRYGIQQLPTAGSLYLELGKRNIELEKTSEALATFELGIANASTFSENYFWASKLLKASGNHLWAWVYAEVCYMMTDDPEIMRSCAFIIQECIGKISINPMLHSAEGNNKCTLEDESISGQLEYRTCLVANGTAKDALQPLIAHMRELKENRLLEAFVASLFETTDKASFLKWLADQTAVYEQYRTWRYWNPMRLNSPLERVSSNN